MHGPSGNQLVFFPSSPDVSLDFVSGNIKTLGKTKLTVSLGTNIVKVYIVVYCFYILIQKTRDFHQFTGTINHSRSPIRARALIWLSQRWKQQRCYTACLVICITNRIINLFLIMDFQRKIILGNSVSDSKWSKHQESNIS